MSLFGDLVVKIKLCPSIYLDIPEVLATVSASPTF